MAARGARQSGTRCYAPRGHSPQYEIMNVCVKAEAGTAESAPNHHSMIGSSDHVRAACGILVVMCAGGRVCWSVCRTSLPRTCSWGPIFYQKVWLAHTAKRPIAHRPLHRPTVHRPRARESSPQRGRRCSRSIALIRGAPIMTRLRPIGWLPPRLLAASRPASHSRDSYGRGTCELCPSRLPAHPAQARPRAACCQHVVATCLAALGASRALRVRRGEGVGRR